VLHLSKSGNLILRLENSNSPPTSGPVCDYKLARIGMINNVLGPVKNPYLSIQPSTRPVSRFTGRVLYLVENEQEHR